jgi:hypothetical protein
MNREVESLLASAHAPALEASRKRDSEHVQAQAAKKARGESDTVMRYDERVVEGEGRGI